MKKDFNTAWIYDSIFHVTKIRQQGICIITQKQAWTSKVSTTSCHIIHFAYIWHYYEIYCNPHFIYSSITFSVWEEVLSKMVCYNPQPKITVSIFKKVWIRFPMVPIAYWKCLPYNYLMQQSFKIWNLCSIAVYKKEKLHVYLFLMYKQME